MHRLDDRGQRCRFPDSSPTERCLHHAAGRPHRPAMALPEGRRGGRGRHPQVLRPGLPACPAAAGPHVVPPSRKSPTGSRWRRWGTSWRG
eukprot:9493285-Pyramimonas_sp.AAC.1